MRNPYPWIFAAFCLGAMVGHYWDRIFQTISPHLTLKGAVTDYLTGQGWEPAGENSALWIDPQGETPDILYTWQGAISIAVARAGASF